MTERQTNSTVRGERWRLKWCLSSAGTPLTSHSDRTVSSSWKRVKFDVPPIVTLTMGVRSHKSRRKQLENTGSNAVRKGELTQRAVWKKELRYTKSDSFTQIGTCEMTGWDKQPQKHFLIREWDTRGNQVENPLTHDGRLTSRQWAGVSVKCESTIWHFSERGSQTVMVSTSCLVCETFKISPEWNSRHLDRRLWEALERGGVQRKQTGAVYLNDVSLHQGTIPTTHVCRRILWQGLSLCLERQPPTIERGELPLSKLRLETWNLQQAISISRDHPVIGIKRAQWFTYRYYTTTQSEASSWNSHDI